jgi:hypothetical protein
LQEFSMSLRLRLAGMSVLVGLTFAYAAGAQTTSPNLKSLHDALHLTSSQESAWNSYQGSVMQPQAQQRRRAAAMLFPTLTAPRRIDLVEAEMMHEGVSGFAARTRSKLLNLEHVDQVQLLPAEPDML